MAKSILTPADKLWAIINPSDNNRIELFRHLNKDEKSKRFNEKLLEFLKMFERLTVSEVVYLIYNCKEFVETNELKPRILQLLNHVPSKCYVEKVTGMNLLDIVSYFGLDNTYSIFMDIEEAEPAYKLFEKVVTSSSMGIGTDSFDMGLWMFLKSYDKEIWELASKKGGVIDTFSADMMEMYKKIKPESQDQREKLEKLCAFIAKSYPVNYADMLDKENFFEILPKLSNDTLADIFEKFELWQIVNCGKEDYENVLFEMLAISPKAVQVYWEKVGLEDMYILEKCLIEDELYTPEIIMDGINPLNICTLIAKDFKLGKAYIDSLSDSDKELINTPLANLELEKAYPFGGEIHDGSDYDTLWCYFITNRVTVNALVERGIPLKGEDLKILTLYGLGDVRAKYLQGKNTL